MRALFVFGLVFTALLFGAPVKAAIPEEVMTAYKAYNTALEQKDYKAAIKHAKTAWQNAETAMGDSNTTGNLAYNYGFLAARFGKMENSVEAITRGVDLAHLAKKDGALSRLEREVELVSVLLVLNKRNKAWKRLDKAREFAGENNIDDSVFAGELMVHQSRLVADNANRASKYSLSALGTRFNRTRRAEKIQSKSAQFSYDAIDIFDKNPDTARASFKAIAYKLIGFSHERDKEWEEALLAYQESMKIQQAYSDIDDRGYITTIGRWINVRTHFLHDLEYEEALEQGLCKCWPYDKEKNIRAKPIKRVPPIMPRKASTSGFSIVRFDLDDDGNVINPEILNSWPVKMYDRSSLNSLKRWKYETKADGKDGAQRTGIVSTIKYILTDYMGNDPI